MELEELGSEEVERTREESLLIDHLDGGALEGVGLGSRS